MNTGATAESSSAHSSPPPSRKVGSRLAHRPVDVPTPQIPEIVAIRIFGIGVGAGMAFLSVMPVNRTHHCWRSDLSEFRGLTEAERSLFLLVLEWFENFRLRCGLEAGRDSVEAFWRNEVVPQGRPRKHRQLEQWAGAIKWYLNWLDACAIENTDHRSLREWARTAVRSAGVRRGLALRTTRCYGGWAVRYATFAGHDREMRRLETANRFLASLVDDEDCSYSTQKQALNALTLFFKEVWGVEDPDFGVKLKRAN